MRLPILVWATVFSFETSGCVGELPQLPQEVTSYFVSGPAEHTDIIFPPANRAATPERLLVTARRVLQRASKRSNAVVRLWIAGATDGEVQFAAERVSPRGSWWGGLLPLEERERWINDGTESFTAQALSALQAPPPPTSLALAMATVMRHPIERELRRELIVVADGNEALLGDLPCQKLSTDDAWLDTLPEPFAPALLKHTTVRIVYFDPGPLPSCQASQTRYYMLAAVWSRLLSGSGAEHLFLDGRGLDYGDEPSLL